jgi:hypothetical protein
MGSFVVDDAPHQRRAVMVQESPSDSTSPAAEGRCLTVTQPGEVISTFTDWVTG